MTCNGYYFRVGRWVHHYAQPQPLIPWHYESLTRKTRTVRAPIVGLNTAKSMSQVARTCTTASGVFKSLQTWFFSYPARITRMKFWDLRFYQLPGTKIVPVFGTSGTTRYIWNGVVHILRHQVLGHFYPPSPRHQTSSGSGPPPIWRHQRPPSPPIWPLYVLVAAVPVDQNLHRRHQAIRLFLHWGDHDLSLTSGSYSHRPFLPLWLWCCCNMRTFTMTIPCVIQSTLDWGMVYATHWTAALTKLWLDGPEADPGKGGGGVVTEISEAHRPSVLFVGGGFFCTQKRTKHPAQTYFWGTDHPLPSVPRV